MSSSLRGCRRGHSRCLKARTTFKVVRSSHNSQSKLFILGGTWCPHDLSTIFSAARGTLGHLDVITAVEPNTLAPLGRLSIHLVLPRSIRDQTICWHNHCACVADISDLLLRNAFSRAQHGATTTQAVLQPRGRYEGPVRRTLTSRSIHSFKVPWCKKSEKATKLRSLSLPAFCFKAICSSNCYDD